MIPVRSLSIPNVLQIHARTTPSAPAVVWDGGTTTWRDLLDRCNRIANGLKDLGLVRGDRVALLYDNSPELLELILGTMISGGVVVPLSGLMTQEIITRMLESSQSRFLFVQGRFKARFGSLDGLGGIPKPRRFTSGDSDDWNDYEAWILGSSNQVQSADYPLDDSISILYTSGTTGVPKGMEHSHLARLLYPLVLGPLFKIDQAAKTILITPMYHNGTWTTMLPTLYSGGTVVIAEKFSTQQFQALVEREACTHAFMVPTQLTMLSADPEFQARTLATMRLIMVSGAPLTSDTLDRMRTALPHLDLCEIYGMGEGFMTFASTRASTLNKVGSVGRPIAQVDTDIKIIGDDDKVLPVGEIGEIVGTSGFMLKGYHRQEELTLQSLWYDGAGRAYLRSGDLGYLDEDGFVYLAGRKKDVIISGGVKIYATDLEEVFAGHPDVLEVAVVAIPHQKWGETPLVLAIMKATARISEDELRDWGNAQLGKTQRVSRVEFRSSFPRNALDKIVKRQLREPYWRKAEGFGWATPEVKRGADR